MSERRVIHISSSGSAEAAPPTFPWTRLPLEIRQMVIRRRIESILTETSQSSCGCLRYSNTCHTSRIALLVVAVGHNESRAPLAEAFKAFYQRVIAIPPEQRGYAESTFSCRKRDNRDDQIYGILENVVALDSVTRMFEDQILVSSPAHSGQTATLTP